MSRYNSFPRIAARRSVGLLFLCSLSFTFLAATTIESFGQSSSGRPVARLITAYPSRMEPPQTQHGMNLRRPAAITVASAPVAPNSLERQAFNLINSERERNGLSPLVWDSELCRVARGHSETMGRLNFFDHEGPDGNLLDRVGARGVMWRSLGENIAFNQGDTDPAGLAVNQWMHSPKHRANILRGNFTHSAIGVARMADGRVYLTQVFIMR
ncbi:MAG TPA: CAP domain-containing protein [Pyrinomonadaceae bacterium]|nr:CAP domain-containing protein [Pyrinomonadaceae bacterium]